MTEKSVSEATAEVAAAARIEAAATVEAVVADAAAKVAAAQETAQEIVEAAIQAPLAQRVADLETENEETEEWEASVERQLSEIGARLQGVETRLAEALATLAQQPTLVAVASPVSSSTPPASPEAVETLVTEAATIVDPAIPSAVAVAVPVAAAPGKKRTTRLI